MDDWNAQNDYAWQYGEQRTNEMHTRFGHRFQQHDASPSPGNGSGWQPSINQGRNGETKKALQ